MSDGLRVAFASTDGRNVDQHFGQAGAFYVWQIGPETAEMVGKVTAITTADDEEDRIAARASAIADCAIVYTVQIGGPAAAKLVSRRIHPMKTAREVPIAEVVEKLQDVLRGTPPPWLRKAMAGPAPEESDEPVRG
jgi:nitrogen fixation protein NifX